MDVVERHDQRLRGGDRGEQLPQRDPRVLDPGGRAGEAEQRADAVGHLGGDGGVHQPAELRACVVRRVVLADRGERLHRLGQRPVGHALAVGEAPARADRRRLFDVVQELRDEP